MRNRLKGILFVAAVSLTIYMGQACNEANEMNSKMDKNMNEKKIINSDKAPAAIGPYSQAIMVGNTFYSSGQIPIDPASGKLIEGDIQAQTDRIMKNHIAVLEEAGLTLDNVVKVTIFMTDLGNYKAINETYASFFSDVRPAREAVQVSALPAGAEIEISLIAVKF